jgi:hypothetical protein
VTTTVDGASRRSNLLMLNSVEEVAIMMSNREVSVQLQVSYIPTTEQKFLGIKQKGLYAPLKMVSTVALQND